jgi:hypothetical protein
VPLNLIFMLNLLERKITKFDIINARR